MASRVDDSERIDDRGPVRGEVFIWRVSKEPQVVSGLAFRAIDSPRILLFLAINQYLQIAAVAILSNR